MFGEPFERVARKGLDNVPKLPKEILVSSFTKEKLKLELGRLEEKVEQVLLMIGEAGGTSDWHDNFALDQANRDFDFYSLRRLLIKGILKQVRLIEPRRETDVVGLGNRVVIYFERGRRAREVTLLGDLDAGRKPNWISVSSPLGRKLLGKRAGEGIRLKLDGKSQVVWVNSILPGDFGENS